MPAGSAAMVRFAVSRMGEGMSAATMTESTAMKSTVTAGKLVSTVTKSIMIKSIMIKSVTPTISTIVWMAPAAVSVCRAVSVRGVSAAVAVSTWIVHVVAALSRNYTK